MVFKMAESEFLYRLVAIRFWVRGLELSEELDVAVFALKAESACVVRKQIGTAGFAEIVLMGFYMLGKDNSLCQSDLVGIVFREVALWGESKIHIPFDTGMVRKDHVSSCLMHDNRDLMSDT